jgi:hypothetical protein
MKVMVAMKLHPEGNERFVEYIKVREFEGTEPHDPPTPKKGWCYSWCHLDTSPVQDFEQSSEGVWVKTCNSHYLFYTDELSKVEELVDAYGLSEHKSSPNSKSTYWGCDARPHNIYGEFIPIHPSKLN